MTKLNLKLIRTLGLSEKTHKPDWDDTAIDFTLSNGITLTGYTQLNNQSIDTESLEGLDGFIYITTFEELERLNKMSYEEVLQDVKSKNSEFNVEEY